MQKQTGFTLIELLIVIVIIGILAGVLVAVIDPAAQQDRARDAGIQAAINKVVLATEGFISAYGVVPNDVQFLSGLKDVSEHNNTCQNASESDCLFSVTGNPLPSTCNGAPWDWNGDEASHNYQCYFRYEGNVDGDSGHFRVWGRSYGLRDILFHYDNSDGGMKHCHSYDPWFCWTP